MKYKFRKVIIITGHYGCGKTNLALNLAKRLRGKISIVDIDTVNPYFRTADHAESLKNKGINVIYPMYAGTNLDIPVLDFDLESIISESDHTIIDVGGSDAGAFPIGRYRAFLESLGGEVEILYVFNMYRFTDRSAEETVSIMKEIETACGMKCTALVNNSNLGADTTSKTTAASEKFADEVSRLSGLPLLFTCVAENEKEADGRLSVKRLVTLPWENNN